ncbi:hypothetical protein [Afipia felis]|uniref:hypothetical protein n=1 Tax=Afipia felis TaxID=1035 RepID=UPI0012E17922|nr:hypothetical protein [Afipia felis]
MNARDIISEIDRHDGIIPATPETVGVLVAEIKRLRSLIGSKNGVTELRESADARRLRYGFTNE